LVACKITGLVFAGDYNLINPYVLAGKNLAVLLGEAGRYTDTSVAMIIGNGEYQPVGITSDTLYRYRAAIAEWDGRIDLLYQMVNDLSA
jgi:hypothetical protein